MGIFSFLSRKNQVNDPLHSISENGNGLGKNEVISPSENGMMENTPAVGINLLFEFLERNHEEKGYNDALINADNTHLNQNTEALKNELERTIRRVKTFYEDFIKEINFHIASRSRSGMVDTVEELTMKKEIAESHIKKVLEIEAEMQNGKGDSQGIIMSYTRGFKNGLAALSHQSILKRKL